MSRIGKKPVTVPSGVTAKVDGHKDRRSRVREGRVEVLHRSGGGRGLAIEGNADAASTPLGQRFQARARDVGHHARAGLQNLVNGVTKGFEKKLEINGVGYKAAIAGKNLQLSLGFSHDVLYPIRRA